jgi:hypothetical protein
LTKVNLSEPKRRKNEPKIVDYAFFRYAHNITTYRYLVINFDTPEQNMNIIIESRDAPFFKHIFPMRGAGTK